MSEVVDAFNRASRQIGSTDHMSHSDYDLDVGVLPVFGVKLYGDLPYLDLVHPEPQLSQAARNL